MPAQSKQQQKFMGIVRAIQKGDQPASKFSKKARDAAKDMKKKDVEKFASTKHKGLPKKVEQELREKIRTMVEDYVETCGYRFSATNPEYKLKSPGGTGEEDRELKNEVQRSLKQLLTKIKGGKMNKDIAQDLDNLVTKGEGFVVITKSKKNGYNRFDANRVDDRGIEVVPHMRDFRPGKIKGMMRYKPEHAMTDIDWKDVKDIYMENTMKEGFGSGEFLTKTEKKKFEKERLENAEVLGYELTGTKDIKEGFASDAQRRAAFASGYKAKGKKKKKNETINEDGHTDVPSVVRKLKTSIEDSLQILGYLKKINDAEPLPSWWTDKVTLSANYLNSARDYILNPHESINEMSDKSKKVINKLGKKEKEVFLTMVDMLGFDQVMSDYKRDKKAFKQALKDMTESVFAVRQDKIKDDERYAKKPNFDYDPEKGKSRIRKVNEKVVKGTEKVLKFTKIKDKSLVKHLKDITKKVGADLQKYSDGYRVSADGDMKKLSAVVDYVMNKSIKKGIMTGGGMSNINLVKEFRNKREADTALDQIGHKALYMIGAKDFVFGKSGGKNSLVFKIMRNSKGVSHIRITLTSLDLYDMEFLAIRAGKIRVKSKEKGVYGDQLGVMIKKNTGLNVRL